MKKITICGSIFFAKDMIEYKNKLEELDIQVSIPTSVIDMGEKAAQFSGNHKETAKSKIRENYIKKHFDLISKSDSILVLNLDKNGQSNYIGGNTFLEIGHAFSLSKDIFLLNSIPENSFRPEIEAMQPIILNNDLEKINKYYKNLPKVFVSSINSIKIDSVSFVTKEFGDNFDVIGYQTKSGVPEQPESISQIHEGAVNRLEDLQRNIKGREYEYLVSIESGIVKLHKDYNYFDCDICLVESKSGERKISISTNLEFPKDMTDLVPDVYADLGVLVQEKYGYELKDPFNYFTNGKVSRLDLLKSCVRNAFGVVK